jgi:NADH:ubiquinone oxidoreductase subunit E
LTDPHEIAVRAICRDRDGDRIRLLDIAREVQRRYRCVSPEATRVIAEELDIPRAEVMSLVSFYSFLSEEPQGKSGSASGRPRRTGGSRSRGRPALA